MARLIQGFGIITNGILFSYFAEAPFIYIRLLHLSESAYGCLGLGIAIASLLGSIVSRQLLKIISIKILIILGAIIMLLSSLLLFLLALLGFINAQHQVLSVIYVLLPVMLIVFGGYGFVMPLTLSTALQKYQSVLGSAGALFGLSYCFLVALITWGMGCYKMARCFPCQCILLY